MELVPSSDDAATPRPRRVDASQGRMYSRSTPETIYLRFHIPYPENRRMLGLIRAVSAGSKTVISDGEFRFRAPLRTLESADPARTHRRAA